MSDASLIRGWRADYILVDEIGLPDPTATQPLSMSSREIADLTGKQHHHVTRDIRNLIVSLYGWRGATFDAVIEDDPTLVHLGKSVTWVADARGYISSFNLDKEHSFTLVAGYDARLRMAIVKRWQELEVQVLAMKPALPDFTDPVAAARAWANEYEGRQIEAQRAEHAVSALANVERLLGEAQPKVEVNV